MDSLLLATKLQIPPPPYRALQRTRLSAVMERGVPHHKLIQIAAPAGYGKTTLLVQWAQASSYPVAWLSLGASENDLERFLRYLVVAWEKVQPGITQTRLGVLLGGMAPDTEAVLAAFINVANDLPNHLAFVLDDYHLIEDPSIHQALTFLLDHLPPTLHFVLAGRDEPPLPLPRYRARNELLELRAEDLQFSEEETAGFLREVMRLALDGDAVTALHAQLEGWIAGLQLVALSLRRQRVGTDVLAVSGRHRFIADYLSQDVIQRLPEDLRRFLLQTSILDRLCGPLCDAVTGSEGSQQLLEILERDNLFLVAIDDSREWFRYHQLFADFLRGELQRHTPDEAAILHRRAARWYLAHDLPDQAMSHAVAGADAGLAVQIFDAYVNVKLNTGELRVVKRWLESIPAEWHAAYPVLGIAQAGLLAFTGAFDACVRCIDDVERRLASQQGDQAQAQLAKVTAVRCAIACMQDDVNLARRYADQALRDLATEDYPFLHLVYGAVGDAYRRRGNWNEARQYYHKVLDLPPSPFYRFHSVHVYGAMADLELRQGRLHSAAACWQEALVGIEDRATWGRFPLPLIGWVYIRMGEILYEWNELEVAGEHLARGLPAAEVGGDVRALIAGSLLAGRLRLTAGDHAAAADYLERARPLVAQVTLPEWTGRFQRFELELCLAQNRIDTAVTLADDMLRSGQREDQSDNESAQLAVARLMVVKGDALAIDQAASLINRLLQSATAEGRMGVQIEALALKAMTHWRRGQQVDAITALEYALRLAQPEGYVRLFADMGLPMARLLQEARARAVMPLYVEKLLAAFQAALTIPAADDAFLPEPLTQREQEVLALIAAGLTNREIADRLVVSPETVKKHSSSIYSKLGVSNRMEAVARARQLDLLG